MTFRLPDLHHGNAHAEPLGPVGYTTVEAPAPAATCECGAPLATEDEQLDDRCAGCSAKARARWDAAAARRQPPPNPHRGNGGSDGRW